ncbi:MAG: hypothetical protein L0322_21135, partial [Chloroflexi bacterium]|nr:hypothetical protein [Chloroflexota bacterium]
MSRDVVLFGLVIVVLLVACSGGETTAGPTRTSRPAPAGQSTIAVTGSPAGTDDPYAEERAEMVQEGIIDWGITDPAVIEAMRLV